MKGIFKTSSATAAATSDHDMAVCCICGGGGQLVFILESKLFDKAGDGGSGAVIMWLWDISHVTALGCVVGERHSVTVTMTT